MVAAWTAVLRVDTISNQTSSSFFLLSPQVGRGGSIYKSQQEVGKNAS